MYQFIVNPNAQGGRGIRIWKKLEFQLQRACVEYYAHMTDERGDARTIASQLTEQKKEACCIVVVGGDGTLSEVLDGLSFSAAVTIGYIPVGFTRDFARSIHLPRKPKACLQRIINMKQTKMLDYGVVTYGDSTEHRRFLISTAIGADTCVMENALSVSTKKRIRFWHIRGLVDLLIGMKQIVGATPVKGYLLLDGIKKVEFNRLYHISAHIHPYTGDGFRTAPKANCSDGKLTICVIHSTSRIHLVPVCLRAKLGSLGRDRGVRFYECEEAQIHLDQPRAVCVDGQSCRIQTDIHVGCIERKLKVIK